MGRVLRQGIPDLSACTRHSVWRAVENLCRWSIMLCVVLEMAAGELDRLHERIAGHLAGKVVRHG
jgi:hypothetical protein